jgi:hypothetical protein
MSDRSRTVGRLPSPSSPPTGEALFEDRHSGPETHAPTRSPVDPRSIPARAVTMGRRAESGRATPTGPDRDIARAGTVESGGDRIEL